VIPTRRAALLLAAPVPAVAFLPSPWAAVAAGAWFLGVAFLVRRDHLRALGPADIEVTRTVPVKLSIGVPNPVTLHVRSLVARRGRLLVRETPSANFDGPRLAGPLDLVPRGTAEVALRFTPAARGAYRFGDVGVRSFGPAGLATRTFDVPLRQEVRVYPDITAVHTYSLLARRGTLHEIGVRAARFAGAGTEFESLRDYESGDDYRDVDWKATARRGKPVVRHFQAERSQNIVLAVDAGRLMTAQVGELSKLDRAINAALLLAYLAVQAGDNVGLLVFGRDVHTYLPPRKGHRQFLAVLEALYAVEGRVEEPDYAGALRYLATRLSRRSLVVLFTELAGTEPSRRLLSVLNGLATRHLPLVVTQRNAEVEAIAAAEPDGALDAFSSAIAADLLHDKAAAVRLLRARGSLVLDVVPEELSVAAVNRFLEIKARGRL
jgi:uncharacterized protein (DUF58 family)